MSAQPTAIIKPGSSLSRAAQPLSSPHRAEGKYPYQWLYEGPNARFARPSGIVAVPAIVAPATSASVNVLSPGNPQGGWQVPEGYRFVLTDLLMGTNATGYSPGQGLITFSLVVLYSTGPRNVEYLSNLDYPTGKFVTIAGAFETELSPIRQRLEFQPLDVLQVVVTNNGLGAPAPTDVLLAILQGFTYPNSEAA
jgi:hypothetical protein